MQYRLIALDLDGTLLGRRKEISPRTRAALAAARERGLITVIATGRTPQSARRFSRAIGGGPVICCNGAGVLDESGEFLVQKGIPLVPLRHVLELCRRDGVLAECYTTRGIVMDQPLAQAATYFRWVRGRGSVAGALWRLVKIWHINRMKAVPNLIRWAERPDRPPVLKLMLVGAPERLARLADQIRRETPGLEVSSSGHDNLEITAGGVSKGSALKLLGARLQVPPEAMIAVGDSENDLEMLRYAGLGVAMGNAEDRVKAAADRVTATCDEDGVAVLLEEVCLR
ncbi:MAG: Cof-type HAD-IIB family hydrolase [Bacillota bacterium]